MWAAAPPAQVSARVRRDLESLAADRSAPARVARRARVVLAAAEGLPNRAIAARLGISRPTVLLWRARFGRGGVEALRREAPRPGRPRIVDEARVQAIVRATLETAPHATRHWTVRGMAAAHGLSPSTVQRIWKAHGIRPRLVEAFDPESLPIPP